MDNTLAMNAEQSMLGALMLDNRAWDRVGDLLTPADFGVEAHRLIWEAISELSSQGKPFDPFLVAARLDQTGTLHRLPDGMSYLGLLLSTVASAANVRHYADRIREQSVLRQLVSAASEISEEASNGDGEASEILETAAQRIGAIADQGQRGRGALTMNAVMRDVVAHLDAVYQQDGQLLGVPTGYADLDRKTAGLQPGDLVILAGRPSSGKTTLAINIAEHVAIQERRPALVISLEMSARSLGLRLVASQARLDFDRVRRADLDDNDGWTQLTSATARIHDAPLLIDDAAGLTVADIAARARRVSREHDGLALIVVDYLQLIQTRGRVENRNLEVAKISQGLKSLAKSLNVPVIAASQLSRAVEQRGDKRPMMSDLRDSGGIEQDADIIAFIYRDEMYHEDSPDKGTAEIILAKQRNGETGTIRLAFQGRYCRFDTLASDWRPCERERPKRNGKGAVYDY